MQVESAGESFGSPSAAVNRLVRLAIRAYRSFLSPLSGAACRFEPTCSRYAEEALERHGLARGAVMAIRRLIRCHPWNAGGYDPVA